MLNTTPIKPSSTSSLLISKKSLPEFNSIARLGSIALVAILPGCTTQKALVNKKPNIVYILVDDMGYNDISVNGQQKFKTPTIDKMAAEGMLFTQHYSGSTVSAPSRAALLTGLHTGHVSVRGNVEKKPEGQAPMAESELTIAQLLKERGYATGAFGKWGLGYPGSVGDPNNKGFDEFFGYNCQRLAHRYYPPYLWHNQVKVHLEGNDWTNTRVYAQDVIQEKTLEFIDANKNRPFFLYVPILLPHAELLVPEDSILQSYRGLYNDKPFIGRAGADYGPGLVDHMYCSQKEPRATHAAMIARIDFYIGEILAKIKSLGLDENTLVMFTSDNGPHQEGGADPDFFDSNGPYRGYKRDLYEGGIRVPLIARWPGKIAPGKVTDHISAFWDIFPTFAELTGGKVEGKTDGISMLPTLLGRSNQRQHRYLYWEFHELNGRQAVRKGNWKAVRYNVKTDSGSTVELYDLDKDAGETTNLAAKYPDVAKEMSDIMQQARVPSKVFNFGMSTIKGD